MSTDGSLNKISHMSINKYYAGIVEPQVLFSIYKLSLVVLYIAISETTKPEDINKCHQVTTSTKYSDSTDRWCAYQTTKAFPRWGCILHTSILIAGSLVDDILVVIWTD